MKFSIVTPTLNRITYLKECIESVLAQDHEDAEHIIVDGGSVDGTVKMLESLGDRYGARIRWISERDNGISDAVNKGLQMAAGDVINWIGSDDKLAQGAISTVARYFEGNPTALWLYGSYVVIDANGEFLRMKKATDFDYGRFVRSGYICGPSVYVRRGLAKRAGAVREDLSYAMDFEWCLRMAEFAHPHRLDSVLGYFRWHPGSISMAGRMAQLDEGLKISLMYAQTLRSRAQIVAFYKTVKVLAWLRRVPWRMRLDRFGA